MRAFFAAIATSALWYPRRACTDRAQRESRSEWRIAARRPSRILPLSSFRWAELAHAYGDATDIPELLERAPGETRSASQPKSAWFDLWSALCHQGDTYTASYAAAPHLVAMARAWPLRRQYEPLLLVASIEQARLEGRGPAVPPDLGAAYRAAVAEARRVAEAALPQAWDEDSRTAFAGSLAALSGDAAGARAIFDTDVD